MVTVPKLLYVSLRLSIPAMVSMPQWIRNSRYRYHMTVTMPGECFQHLTTGMVEWYYS